MELNYCGSCGQMVNTKKNQDGKIYCLKCGVWLGEE